MTFSVNLASSEQLLDIVGIPNGLNFNDLRRTESFFKDFAYHVISMIDTKFFIDTSNHDRM